MILSGWSIESENSLKASNDPFVIPDFALVKLMRDLKNIRFSAYLEIDTLRLNRLIFNQLLFSLRLSSAAEQEALCTQHQHLTPSG